MRATPQMSTIAGAGMFTRPAKAVRAGWRRGSYGPDPGHRVAPVRETTLNGGVG